MNLYCICNINHLTCNTRRFLFNRSWCCSDQLTCAQTQGRHISTDAEKHCSRAYVKAFWRDAKWLRTICYSYSLSSANRLHDGSQHRFCFLCTFQAQFPPTLQPQLPPSHSQTHIHARTIREKSFVQMPLKWYSPTQTWVRDTASTRGQTETSFTLNNSFNN